MQWQLVVALVIGIPVILFPLAYIWYLNIGGIVAAVRQARETRGVRGEEAKLDKELPQEEEYERALTKALEQYPWHQP
jgi:hypothetical protein